MRNMIILILSILIMILLAGAAIVLFSSLISEMRDREVQNSETAAISESQSKTSGTDESFSNVEKTETDSSNNTSESTADRRAEIVKNEEIAVMNNSLEYDLKVFLYENGLGHTFLKFEYYKDGIGTVKELDEMQIPELKDIFTNRSQDQNNESGFIIRNLFLNTKLAKTYFMVNGKTYGENVEAALYCFDLNSGKIARLFWSKGVFTDIMFSKDLLYMAFSFIVTGDNENSLLQVVKCDTDELIINRSMDLNSVLLGNNKDAGINYDYSLLSWYTAKILKLKEITRPKNQGAFGVEGEQSAEVFYDVVSNSFVNADGSTIKSNNSTPYTVEKNKSESEAVKTLRMFYTYIASDTEYGKAYEMLDDNFVAKLGLLKQFDVTELKKSDMDLDSFPLYATLFKAVKIGSVVNERTSEGITKIYYYQILEAEGSEEIIKQLMVAEINKTGSVWKVLEIADGNAAEARFR